VLLPWQAEAMRLIWDTGGEIDSRTAHTRLRGSATQVSRASAINFLKKMAEEGFLEHREVTSKGGAREQ
jgi:Fe2+ or Zn2+ uptake regulation protein